MSRFAYSLVFFSVTLTDWAVNYFRPSENAGNWLAAFFGAFVIRFIWGKDIPLKTSVISLIVAFIIACLFGPDVTASGGWFGIKRPEGNYAAVALVGDVAINSLAWLVRLANKIGDDTLKDPGPAIDAGLTRTERVFDIIVKYKAPLLAFFERFTPKK